MPELKRILGFTVVRKFNKKRAGALTCMCIRDALFYTKVYGTCIVDSEKRLQEVLDYAEAHRRCKCKWIPAAVLECDEGRVTKWLPITL
jgi:hypothetical protein